MRLPSSSTQTSAVAVSEAHEFVHYLAMSLILRGWALASQGEFERGINDMQDGLEKQRAGGALLYETYGTGIARRRLHHQWTLCPGARLSEPGGTEARSREQLRPVLRERDIPVVRRRLPTIGQRCNSGRAIYPERPCDRARAGFPIVPIENSCRAPAIWTGHRTSIRIASSWRSSICPSARALTPRIWSRRAKGAGSRPQHSSGRRAAACRATR